MRILLDTHTLLWFLDDSPQLSGAAKRLIEDDTTDVYVSVASLWEIAIKTQLGKLRLREPFGALFPRQLEINDLESLGVTIRHLGRVATLPLHHRDPFDRLLVAQALDDDLALISADAAFDFYAVRRIW